MPSRVPEAPPVSWVPEVLDAASGPQCPRCPPHPQYNQVTDAQWVPDSPLGTGCSRVPDLPSAAGSPLCTPHCLLASCPQGASRPWYTVTFSFPWQADVSSERAVRMEDGASLARVSCAGL